MRTFLREDEIRRFNPALLKKVPANATVYLPLYVKELGDVSFWQRRPDAAFVEALNSTPSVPRLQNAVPSVCAQSFRRHPFVA